MLVLSIVVVLFIVMLVVQDRLSDKTRPYETYDQGGFPDGDWDITVKDGELVPLRVCNQWGRWATEEDAQRECNWRKNIALCETS